MAWHGNKFRIMDKNCNCKDKDKACACTPKEIAYICNISYTNTIHNLLNSKNQQ